MPLSQNGAQLVFQGGVNELRNIPQSVDQQFAQGDIAEFQLRLRFHVPGLEGTVRTVLQPALGNDLLAVRAPGPILRIRWIRNLGPIAVAAILVGVAIIVAILTLFLLFKFSPGAATSVAGFLIIMAAVAALAFGFTQRRR